MLVLHQYHNKLEEGCLPFLFLSLSDSYSYSWYLRKKVTLKRIEQIVEQLGYLLMDIILMSFKKINTENQLFKELLDSKLQFRKEEDF
jgi:hypothetical protein